MSSAITRIQVEPRVEETTLMIRNLPRRFAAWDLVAELELYTSREAFDFVYVPWDRKGVNNVGYGFVNFADAQVAAAVQRSMDGRAWCTGSRIRPVKVQAAHVQGLAENLERFAALGDEVDPSHVPLVFAGGEAVRVEAALSPASSGSTCGKDGAWSSEGSSQVALAPAPAQVCGPPPGLEGIEPLATWRSPGFEACRESLCGLLQELLSQPAAPA